MKLRSKLILFFVIFTVSIIGGFVYYLNIYFKNYLEKQIINNFNSFAEFSENSYFNFIKALKMRTIDWSSDGYIRNTTEKILNSSGIERDVATRELGNYLRKEKIIYDQSVIIVDILDEKGIVIASSRDKRLGINEKAEEETLEAHHFGDTINAKFGEAFVASVIYEEDEYDKPMIHVTARIFSNRETADKTLIPLNAVILLHFANIELLKDILIGRHSEENRKKDNILLEKDLFNHYKTIDSYFVNQNKLMMTSSRFVEDAILKQKVDTWPVKVCFEKNEEISGKYVNYLGDVVFGSSKCLEDMVLIIEAKSDEIFSPLKDLNWRIFLGAILFLIVNIFGIVIGSNLTLKNLKIIIAAIEEISKNNFKKRVNIKSNDEIGYLANIFNRMVDNIVRSQDELREAETQLVNINLNLEKKIEERTDELEKLKNSLEQTVVQETQELQKKIEELEKFKELTVGRELKMIELKKEIEELKKHG